MRNIISSLHKKWYTLPLLTKNFILRSIAHSFFAFSLLELLNYSSSPRMSSTILLLLSSCVWAYAAWTTIYKQKNNFSTNLLCTISIYFFWSVTYQCISLGYDVWDRLTIAILLGIIGVYFKTKIQTIVTIIVFTTEDFPSAKEESENDATK